MILAEQTDVSVSTIAYVAEKMGLRGIVYLAVIKPIDASGSKSVQRIDSDDELEKYFAETKKFFCAWRGYH